MTVRISGSVPSGPWRAGGGDRRGGDVPLPADAGAAPGQRAGDTLGLLLIPAGLAVLCGLRSTRPSWSCWR